MRSQAAAPPPPERRAATRLAAAEALRNAPTAEARALAVGGRTARGDERSRLALAGGALLVLALSSLGLLVITRAADVRLRAGG